MSSFGLVKKSETGAASCPAAGWLPNKRNGVVPPPTNCCSLMMTRINDPATDIATNNNNGSIVHENECSPLAGAPLLHTVN